MMTARTNVMDQVVLLCDNLHDFRIHNSWLTACVGTF